MNDEIVRLLRCPKTGQALRYQQEPTPSLVTEDGHYRYPVSNGIAMLLADDAEELHK